MKLCIMQPYFFPYFGHFQLIAQTDFWIVFDVVQYNPKTWMSRNRILHPTQAWQYINVPVAKQPHGTPIHAIRVQDRAQAEARLLGQLEHYRKHAPHFNQVKEIVRSAFAIGSDRLVDLNVSGLKAVCAYLDLKFDCELCSQRAFNLDTVQHAGQWALEIAKQLGASEYVNPPGGQSIFKQGEWDAASIRLTFPPLRPFVYDCAPYEFVENLSILDVLMWNDAATVSRSLREPRTS
jgi:hypothetical protein